jgi:riboflavin biosynthesis pyrimidine reductase
MKKFDIAELNVSVHPTSREEADKIFNALSDEAEIEMPIADQVWGDYYGSQAFEAGLVDELQLFVTPVVVGGGKQSLPRDVRRQLGLLDERRFRNGVVYLRYAL